MTEIDYPRVYYASDSVSLDAQRKHFLLLRIQLSLLALLSLSALWRAYVPIALVPTTERVILGILFAAILVQLLPRLRLYERIWFDARAVAESAKSISWRYMARAQPYDTGHDESAIEAQFHRDLTAIREARANLAGHIAGVQTKRPEFPARLREVRTSSFETRKDLYSRLRLRDQLNWYDPKAKANRQAANTWFWAALAAQGLAIVSALVQVNSTRDFAFIPVFMTLAAVFVAWSQAKRFDELVNAYGLAAQELGTLDGYLEVVEDGTFGKFVTQIEEAISREHTMWLARRGGISPAPF